MRFEPFSAFQLFQRATKLWAAGQRHEFYNLSDRFYDVLRDVAAEARCFKFLNREEHVETNENIVLYSLELCSHGLFEMPFDSTFLAWPEPIEGQWACALLVTIARRGRMTPWGERLPFNGMTHLPHPKATITMCSGMLAVPSLGKIVIQDLSLIVSWESDWKVAFDKPASVQLGQCKHILGLSIYRPDSPRELLEAQGKDGGVTLRNVLYYIGVLNSRGPALETHSPPQNVAERRARQRKEKWLDYHIVRIPQRKPAPLATGGGFHASPRLHWRRGHIRHAHGKAIPVSPCLVGAPDRGSILADYLVE